MNLEDLNTPATNTWCPGCGNFGLLYSVKQTILQLGLTREEIVHVTGIGCHGKFTDYVNVNGIHVIHGRVLPVATAIKLSNHDLTVLGFAGDGDAFNIGMGQQLCFKSLVVITKGAPASQINDVLLFDAEVFMPDIPEMVLDHKSSHQQND